MCFKQRLCVCALDFRLTERLGASERSQGTEMQRGIVKTRVSQASSLFASYRSLELGVPLHEPLILMHSVRGNGRGADVGFRKGRIDTSGNMRLSKPMSRLTTQERVGNAPAKGSEGKCRPVRDSRKQAWVGMTFLVSVSEGRSTLAASGSHVFDHVRANFINVPDRRDCGVFFVELAVSPHWVTARPWDDYC